MEHLQDEVMEHLTDKDEIRIGDETNCKSTLLSLPWVSVEPDWEEIGWTVERYRNESKDADRNERIFRRGNQSR